MTCLYRYIAIWKYNKANMNTLIRVMKALSDPNRIAALKVLESGERCVCELQHLLNLAQPTVSKHMKILEDAGLVKKRRQTAWVLYSLADGSASLYAATMLQHMQHWLDNDISIQQIREKLPAAAALRQAKQQEQ
jgi:ArsR family transcriptional regulator